MMDNISKITKTNVERAIVACDTDGVNYSVYREGDYVYFVIAGESPAVIISDLSLQPITWKEWNT
jgi:hypothetical protein